MEVEVSNTRKAQGQVTCRATPNESSVFVTTGAKNILKLLDNPTQES